MAEFYYNKEDFLQGLLKWEDFVSRNRNRTVLDIQRWSELRNEWFRKNGFNTPLKEKRSGGSKEFKSYHERMAEEVSNPPMGMGDKKG